MILTITSMNSCSSFVDSPQSKRPRPTGAMRRLESASKKTKRSPESDLAANALLLLRTQSSPLVHVINPVFGEAPNTPSTTTNVSKTFFQKPSNPDEFLSVLLSMKGRTVEFTPAVKLMTSGYFTPIDDDYLQGYTKEMVQAVRADDVPTLRRIHQNQKRKGSLLCGSKFGDSILHLACRRGSANVLEYLILELGVSPKVVCDLGRTLFHDALWTAQPNPRILSLLLKTCPELLFVKDHRGTTPLSYAPKKNWSGLCRFLAQHIKQHGTFLNSATAAPTSHVVPLDPVAQ